MTAQRLSYREHQMTGRCQDDPRLCQQLLEAGLAGDQCRWCPLDSLVAREEMTL